MTPVHDNDDYYNHDDHDDNHDPHNAVLERKSQRKQEARLQKMVEDLQAEIRQLKAVAQIGTTGTTTQTAAPTTGPLGPQHAPWTKENDRWLRERTHTPVYTNIATPPTPPMQDLTPKDFEMIRNSDGLNLAQVPKRIIIVGRVVDNSGDSPSSFGTPDGAREIGTLCQVGGNGPLGGDHNEDPDDEDENRIMDRGRNDMYHREFMLVSPSKILVPAFSGTNLITKPYMPFNKVVKKLVKAQGHRGLQLFAILEDVEKYGDKLSDNNKLTALVAVCPKDYEYNAAIQIALQTYTTDIAEGMIKYGVHNGLDAWRKLYNHYVPLAEDFQQIFI